MRTGLSEGEKTLWIRPPLSGMTMPIAYRCHIKKDESAFLSEKLERDMAYILLLLTS
jgi:hypothetical protein